MIKESKGRNRTLVEFSLVRIGWYAGMRGLDRHSGRQLIKIQVSLLNDENESPVTPR